MKSVRSLLESLLDDDDDLFKTLEPEPAIKQWVLDNYRGQGYDDVIYNPTKTGNSWELNPNKLTVVYNDQQDIFYVTYKGFSDSHSGLLFIGDEETLNMDGAFQWNNYYTIFDCSDSNIEILDGMPNASFLICTNCKNLKDFVGVSESSHTIFANGSNFKTLKGLESSRLSKIVLDECRELQNLNGLPRQLDEIRCNHCDSLTSLESTAKSVNKIVVDHCNGISSLQGMIPARNIYLSNLPRLKSLKGAPAECITFYCTSCVNLSTLQGGPGEVKIYKCAFNPKIKSLAGSPYIIKNSITVSNCDNLTSLNGFEPNVCTKINIEKNDKLVSLGNIPESVIFDIFEIYSCKNLVNFKGGPTHVHQLTVSSCDKLESVESVDMKRVAFQKVNCPKLKV